jgi:MFS transporter, PAT family, beta-lactamase induction signal transducer AmpG
MSEPKPARLSTWQSVKAVATDWRPASVSLLQFPSGLPLGLIWLAMPAWLAEQHIDIRLVGLLTLAQAPWTFKFLWAPLVDRYAMPFMGRRRGWMLACQAALLLLGLWLAVYVDHPQAVLMVAALALAIAFVSATQDVAIDAHAVEALRPEEQGAAVGARVTVYRIAMQVSGRLSITAAAWMGWPLVNVVLSLLYVPCMLLTWLAPEPETPAVAPKTMREAVWEPFVGMLSQHRALEILAFVVLYKLSDNLTQSLTGPFLVQMGFNPLDRGIGLGTAALFAIIGGTIAGGLLTQSVGLGRALWIAGLAQMGSNLGYALVAQVGPDRGVVYAATVVEYVTTGMGNGAFGVLLLRLTQKRFSATQYALLSSLFSIPRVFAGPVAGLLADALGWRDFFVFTVVTGIPGLLMLHRFVPWRMREPVFEVAPPREGRPLTTAQITLGALLAGVVSTVVAVWCSVGLDAIRAQRAHRAFDWAATAFRTVWPADLAGIVAPLSVGAIGLLVGLATAAGLVARRQSGIQSDGIRPPALP